jgi:hypothetical protein
MNKGIILLLLVISMGNLLAQLSTSNLLEYQLGNLPYTEPKDLSTLYNQLNLSFRHRGFIVSGRGELFQAPSNDIDYIRFSQRTLRFRNRHIELAAGHFYEILGRGLLLRSYEIPGTVLEDLVYRTRYGFYRDLDGFSVRLNTKVIELKALRGRPLRNDFPPTQDKDQRRPDLVESGELNLVFLENWNFGGTYLKNKPQGESESYGSLFLSGNLPFNTSLYSEYAQELGNGNPNFDISDKSTHAFYVSLSSVIGPLGISAEFKDYNNFLLNFNDPPPLIREHAYVVLNRSTHVLIPVNESGWQTEFFYTFSQGHVFTINFTEAENSFSGNNFLFKEFFSELYYQYSLENSIKLFFDRSQEPFLLEYDRFAAGLYLEQLIKARWGVTLDLEFQNFRRELNPPQNVHNYVAALTISHSPRFSTGLVWERSTDPFLTDNPETSMVESDPRSWLGLILGYQLTVNHTVNLFYGERRGGPACSSGICYEVLDFEGLELRLNSYF